VLTYRVRNLGVAIALAVVAAMLTFFYVSNYKRSVQQGEELVDVYIATQDISAGTTGAEVADSLSPESVARRAVVPGSITDPQQIEKLVAMQPIYAGEQVSTRRFRPVQESGVRGQLKGNLRAFQLPGDEHQLLVGTLANGDRVDIVGTWLYPEGSQFHVSRVLLRDILVLRAPVEGKVTSKLASATNSPYSAVVQISDAQSRKLFWIQRNGEWSMQLRPVTDATDGIEKLETSRTMAQENLGKRSTGRRTR
jgi:Flp pilus assembly protein CpaB